MRLSGAARERYEGGPRSASAVRRNQAKIG
jgi:hypothetical protein